MSDTCNQKDCSEPAAYRFTWPGRDEAGICEKHVGKLRAISEAMGLYVQTIPLSKDRAAEGSK